MERGRDNLKVLMDLRQRQAHSDPNFRTRKGTLIREAKRDDHVGKQTRARYSESNIKNFFDP